MQYKYHTKNTFFVQNIVQVTRVVAPKLIYTVMTDTAS